MRDEGPITVCVVDDDPDAFRLTADWLERENDRLAVRATTSTADALATFDDGSFDCIVSDHHLEDTTEIEFLRAVREQLLADEQRVDQGDVHFGVTIVKRIVEAHDRDVDITDGTEGGARFEVRNVDFGEV